MALALAGAVIPLVSDLTTIVTNISKLGASIQAKVEADNCISGLYAYFLIKCDPAIRAHFLWLRIGFIVGPAQTGGKRYGREAKLAELANVQDFPQKMVDSNFTKTLNEYLLVVQNDLVGRKVMHRNKPNEDFDVVIRLLEDGVFQPMMIFLRNYQYTPETNPSPNAPPSQAQGSSSTQPQQTTSQGQFVFPNANLSKPENSNDQSLSLPSTSQPTAINNNSDIASGSQNNNGSQSSNTTAKTEGSLANITSVNPPSSSTTNTTQEQSGSTPSILPSQGVYLLTPLSISYQGQQQQPQPQPQQQPQSQQPKTSNLVDQQGNLFFKPIATPNLF